MHQSNGQDETLARRRAAYGERGRASCLSIHSADGVLGKTGEPLVDLLLLDNDAGRR